MLLAPLVPDTSRDAGKRGSQGTLALQRSTEGAVTRWSRRHRGPIALPWFRHRLAIRMAVLPVTAGPPTSPEPAAAPLVSRGSVQGATANPSATCLVLDSRSGNGVQPIIVYLDWYSTVSGK